LLITLASELCVVNHEEIGLDESPRHKSCLVASDQFANDDIQAVGQHSGKHAVRGRCNGEGATIGEQILRAMPFVQQNYLTGTH